MPVLSLKDREALAYLYELEQWKALKRFCDVKKLKIMEALLELDMSVPGNEKAVTLLQGQAKALQWLQLEIKNIHKKQMEREFGNKKS